MNASSEPFPAEPLSILLLARSLGVGGTERQLTILAKGLHQRGHKVQVVLFYCEGPLLDELRDSGIEVIDLKKRGRWDAVGFFGRVVRELRRRRPQIIYSFLGGNLVASAARPFIHPTRLIWSIRASNVDLQNYDWLHRAAYELECAFSGSPDLIIANSSAGAAFAIRNGFPAKRVSVVRNGIDTDRFRPDAALRATQRRLLGLEDGEIAVGVLARLDPMKGHSVFLQAASIAVATLPQLRFFCIGEGRQLEPLQQMASALGVAERVTFTGVQDAPAALNALDICCSCSVWGEGLSNSVAEAMACGLTCIVTDVGDSAAIVGHTGTVVPPSSPGSLAEAICTQASLLAEHDPRVPRQRIIDNFSVDAMVDRTIEAFGRTGNVERSAGALPANRAAGVSTSAE